MTITVELPLDSGELVEKALDKARDDELLAMPDLADTFDEDIYPKGTWSEVAEFPPAGGLLSKGKNKAFEPPPPAYLH